MPDATSKRSVYGGLLTNAKTWPVATMAGQARRDDFGGKASCERRPTSSWTRRDFALVYPAKLLAGHGGGLRALPGRVQDMLDALNTPAFNGTSKRCATRRAAVLPHRSARARVVRPAPTSSWRTRRGRAATSPLFRDRGTVNRPPCGP